MLKTSKTYGYSDVSISPSKVSTVMHRADVDTTIDVGGVTLSVPICSAPMPDVCDGEMAYALSSNGVMSFIHRFNSYFFQYKTHVSYFYIYSAVTTKS
jgi:IMP dehydrogenase/GMP reductase